ncbi:MAG TPA: hypothetical protein VG939_07485 [Caulobacteraceae bacterium]|nr:hypothetical protein [Caulobacteraceae bacterium]
MTDVFLAPGLRTPFVKGGTAFAPYDALQISTPIAQAMVARARPDFIVWGEVIPEATVSNIARELVFEARLDPTIPAFSTILACSTSFVGLMEAAGMLGRAIGSVCADGGQGTVALLERV